MHFDWDDEKNEANRQKHGVSFAEARQVFDSPAEHLELFDAEHSSEEDRFIAIGRTDRGLLVVAFTERDESTVRIISARTATAREARSFENAMRGLT